MLICNMMQNSATNKYRPSRYRIPENSHILLWLVKDTCWAMEFKPGGIVMIFPTLAVGIYLTIRSRHIRSELFHNLAVILWIMANSVWMIGEFMNKDARPIAVGFFSTGLLLLAIYYVFYFRKDKAN